MPSDRSVSPFRHVFVTGGTGYLGAALLPRLIARGHRVRALVRPGSERRLPPGVAAVVGDALDAASWAGCVAPADTLVHLVGVAHPAPWKADAFERVDLPAGRAAVAAAKLAGAHLVYLSVAHPAPVMRAYVAVRRQVEEEIRAAGIAATCVRPWYVLGPGHRWAHLLRPLYAVAERLPATRDGARRLGLVTLAEISAALVGAVQSPPAGVRVVEVPEIRRQARSLAAA